jgi:predicted permease
LDLILDCQFWVPLGVLDELQPNTVNQARNYHWLGVVGRLQPGIQPKQVAAELNVIAQRMANAHPDPDKDLGFRFDRAGSMPPRDKSVVMIFLATLSVVALLVLCIACSNVANLSLAQAVERRKDMAVRLALGAAGSHLLRQLTIESVLLALAGGAFGVLLSLWATQSLGWFRLPAPVPLNLAVTVDWHVLLYVFVLCVVTGIMFGLIPAWIVIRPLLSSGLTGGEISGQPRRFWSIRNLLVVSQFAMSLILLCGTSLFLRSLSRAAQIEIGFRSNGLLMMSVDPRLHGYTPEKINQFLMELRQRVSGLPGVVSVAATDAIPLNGGHRSDGFVVEGRPAIDNNFNIVELYMASPGYFSTMGIEQLAGRDFADEPANGPKVAIVNRAFVQTFFPGRNAIGARVRDGSLVYQIIGIVGNTKSRTLGEDYRAVLYRTLAQSVADDPSREGYSIIVRYSNAPGLLGNAVRKQIHDLDSTLAIFDATTMEEHLRDALFLPRLTAALFGIFGFVGLLMASVGLYGVMSYWVTRRTREIGIRLAVGASGREVQRLILRQGMALTLIAIVPGLAIAWAGAKLLSSFLYGVPVHDRVTFTLVPLFLAAVTLAASWFPGRRASRVDPSIALRHD